MFIPINGLMNKGVTWIGGLRASSTGKICRYFFSFAGDGMITTARRWNPDAADASFVLEFYNDTEAKPISVILSQTNTNTTADTEFKLETLSTGMLRLVKGGNTTTLLPIGSPDAGLGLWRIEYNNSTLENRIYKDDILIDTKIDNIGAGRNPTASIFISNRMSGGNGDIGVMADVKFWINSDKKETGDLVLDMPINDNSNTIVDYSPLAQNGTLTPGTGSWAEVCEDDSDWIDSEGWIDSEEWVD